MLSIGFTGTRKGMTELQIRELTEQLQKLQPQVVHHGDCTGADAQFHDLVREHCPECRIVIHPPIASVLRAFKKGDKTRTPIPYLDRNKAIVEESRLLIAAPSSTQETRGGTWSTVRLAKGLRRPVVLLVPY